MFEKGRVIGFLVGVMGSVWGSCPRQVLAQAAPPPTEDQEIVVSATRIESPRSKVGSAVTVISKEDIAARKVATVAEALKGVPGVDVVTSGAAGGLSTVFLRGANEGHTLVLIDGVKANDPISVGRSFNFATLSVDNIERIEVLRGPQGTMYGSDAMGGVINIITKRGKGEAKSYLSLEGGAYQRFLESAGVSGSSGPPDHQLDYSLGVSRLDVNAVSQASPSYGNKEPDRYGNTSLSSRLGLQAGDGLKFNHFLRYNNARTDLDNFGGYGGDDPNRVFYSRTLFTRAESVLDSLDDALHTTAGISYAHQSFDDDNDPDAAHPLDSLRSKYRSSLRKFDIISTYQVREGLTLLGGMQTEEEKGDSLYESTSAYGPYNSYFPKRSITTNSFFTQLQWEYGDLSGTVAGRVDDNSKFGSQSTWRIAPVYRIAATGTRVKGSLGNGYKAPSLYQLYSEYGSQTLRPEKSLGWDLGVEQSLWEERLQVGATYFSNDFDQLVSFDPKSFIYTNIAHARSQGVEWYMKAQPSSDITLGTTYTYTDTRDGSTGLSLLRRPRHKGRLDFTYHPVESWTITGSSLLVGRRADTDFSGAAPMRVGLGSYTLFNLLVSHDLTKATQLYVRWDNIFDKRYEEVLGYGVPGMSVVGGVRFNL